MLNKIADRSSAPARNEMNENCAAVSRRQIKYMRDMKSALHYLKVETRVMLQKMRKKSQLVRSNKNGYNVCQLDEDGSYYFTLSSTDASLLHNESVPIHD